MLTHNNGDNLRYIFQHGTKIKIFAKRRCGAVFQRNAGVFLPQLLLTFFKEISARFAGYSPLHIHLFRYGSNKRNIE
jgi:hypothetical protein